VNTSLVTTAISHHSTLFFTLITFIIQPAAIFQQAGVHTIPAGWYCLGTSQPAAGENSSNASSDENWFEIPDISSNKETPEKIH